MVVLERIGFYFQTVAQLASDPVNLAILFGSVMLGIMFGVWGYRKLAAGGMQLDTGVCGEA